MVTIVSSDDGSCVIKEKAQPGSELLPWPRVAPRFPRIFIEDSKPVVVMQDGFKVVNTEVKVGVEADAPDDQPSGTLASSVGILTLRGGNIPKDPPGVKYPDPNDDGDPITRMLLPLKKAYKVISFDPPQRTPDCIRIKVRYNLSGQAAVLEQVEIINDFLKDSKKVLEEYFLNTEIRTTAAAETAATKYSQELAEGKDPNWSNRPHKVATSLLHAIYKQTMELQNTRAGAI